MSDTREGGIGLCSAVFIVFLVLRLTDHIDWAWYWVASPLWLPVAATLLVIGVIAVVAIPCMTVSDMLKRRRYLAKQRAKDGVPKL